MRYQSFHVLSTLGLLAVAGCGASAPQLPVAGQVTLGDAPLTRGLLTFHPDGPADSATGAQPTARINPAGTYEILTGGKPGAPPGHYKVTWAPGMPTPEEFAAKKGTGPVPVNASYMDPGTTPLKIAVVANAPPGAYDLKLTK